ncbi:hypothetical protein FHU30_001525 [Actinomadura rupiterrae]|nr:hypothetical protein [Actinomadura rupiterrae]
MRRRHVAVLGGLMMAADALAVVAPVSMGVAPAPAAARDTPPNPIRSVA